MSKRKTVMVVDDDPGFLEFMSYLLGGERHRVVLHSQSTTAMDEIRRQRPDIIILDLAMPEKTGWAVVNELRADAATSTIPVIICTAAVQEAERGRNAMAALEVWTILKPFDVSDLLTLIDSIATGQGMGYPAEADEVADEVALAERSTGRQPRDDPAGE